jgi:hypothetical protein
VASQARVVERRDAGGHHLRLTLSAGNADQLDPRLKELARLSGAALRRAIRVAQVREPERWIGVAVAGGHDARDRDRHVGAQRQHLPVLVEQPVARAGGALVAPAQHLLVLERRRPDLAVAGALEAGAHPVR